MLRPLPGALIQGLDLRETLKPRQTEREREMKAEAMLRQELDKGQGGPVPRKDGAMARRSCAWKGQRQGPGGPGA